LGCHYTMTYKRWHDDKWQNKYTMRWRNNDPDSVSQWNVAKWWQLRVFTVRNSNSYYRLQFVLDRFCPLEYIRVMSRQLD